MENIINAENIRIVTRLLHEPSIRADSARHAMLLRLLAACHANDDKPPE